MRNLTVEVSEDQSLRGSGRAVILLKGLRSAPDDVTFNLRPLDSGSGARGSEGESKPLAVRLTSLGLELVVGPEIVENPQFMPGTPAVIDVPKCGVRGEFLWPEITPLSRPKRRHVHAAKPQAVASAIPAGGDVPIVHAGLVFGEANDASSDVLPIEASSTGSADGHTASSEHATSHKSSSGARAVEGSPDEPAAVIDDLRSTERTALDPATAAGSGGWVSRSGALARAAVLVVLAYAAGVASLAVWPSIAGIGRPSSTLAPAPQNMSRTALATLLGVEAGHATKIDEFQLEPIRLLQEADTRLHGPASIQDRTQAGSLLRRYMVTTLGERRTLWALTQLGSVYADPGRDATPDYHKARDVWEIAGHLGDPVAMCFLASLHEHGLAGSPDLTLALEWLQRARRAGGCADVDARIAQLERRR